MHGMDVDVVFMYVVPKNYFLMFVVMVDLKWLSNITL